MIASSAFRAHAPSLPAANLGQAILALALGWGLPHPAGAATAEPSAIQTTGFRVGELKTDYRINPLGLEARHLRFFWLVHGGDQAAWQVQAASAPERLADGRADLWDSGRQEGVATTQVAYGGKPPASRQRAWWRVRAWDAAGRPSEWSAPASFEMGLLAEAEWREARWIGCDRDFEKPEPAPAEVMGPWIEPPAGQIVQGLFRDVDLPNKPVVRAMAWWGTSRPVGRVAVVVNYDHYTGYKRARLDRIMVPRPHGFMDMAFFLRPGQKNRIELRLEKPLGRFAASVGLHIVFADGTEMTLGSGPEWETRGADAAQAAQSVRVVEAYGGPKLGQVNQFKMTGLPPAWFRHTMEVGRGLKRARLFLCALGQGHTYVNGTPVDDSLMGPPQSDYEELAFYTVHDLTPHLRPGANALAVLLDGGWYHEVGGFGADFSYGRPGLKALVALDYADGRTQWFTSGPGWQWKEGAIRAANIYRGEKVDFRRDHDEWKSPARGSGWQEAQVISPRTPKTMAMDVVPVRRGLELKPIKRWQIGPKTWLFDVGEMIHGWVRFTISEPAGTTVRLRYSEYARDGVMENVPVSHWWCHGVTQGDEIISDGRRRMFEPTFAPKSFRFVEVSGVGRAPEDLAALTVNSDIRPLARFESSDPMLNRLFENGMRTYRNYVIHFICDIPRERDLWGAESIYTEAPATHCVDLAPNHRLMNLLWLTGPMTKEGIPGNIGVGKRLTRATNGYIWSVTPLFISSKMFEHYGDLEPARTYYDKLRFLVLDYPRKHGERDGTIPTPYLLSDHAPVSDVKRNPAKGDLITALTYFEALNRFARLAEALGHPADAAWARQHAEKVRATILSFREAGAFTFGNGTHDSLSLAFRAVTAPAERKALAASLVGYYRANGHQFDGGFMSYEILPQLSHFGYVDDAVKMLLNTTTPGPARSIKEYDATTFWEAYYLDHDFQMHRGLNFVAFAHSIGWMITDLAGIRYQAPRGERVRLTLAPKFATALTHASASVELPSGPARSAWKRAGGALRWDVVVPWNTATLVELPEFSAGQLRINGRPLAEAGARLRSAQPLAFELGGGEWSIALSPESPQ
jgi:alpha-L-rhamnosidase